MRSNKRERLGVDWVVTPQERVRAAFAALETEGYEVFTVKDDANLLGSLDDLATRLKQRVYDARVQSEADEIEKKYKEGGYSSSEEMSEELHMIANDYAMQDGEAFDIMRCTNHPDAFEEIYDRSDAPDLTVQAVCAIQEDVRAELDDRGVDMNEPEKHRYECVKCGDVHTPEIEPDECPECGLSSHEEERGYHTEKNGLVCEECLEDDESPDALNQAPPGSVYCCGRCDNPFQQPED